MKLRNLWAIRSEMQRLPCRFLSPGVKNGTGESLWVSRCVRSFLILTVRHIGQLGHIPQKFEKISDFPQRGSPLPCNDPHGDFSTLLERDTVWRVNTSLHHTCRQAMNPLR